MLLVGSGFGSSSLGIEPSAVSLGGRLCDDVVFFNSSAIMCRSIDASQGFTSGSIVVTVQGQSATSSVFRVKDGPSITAVVPSTGSVDGGYMISVIGENLGQQDEDIKLLSIGGRNCTEIVRDAGGRWVNGTAPAGVGARPALELRIAALRYGGEGLFGYSAPDISGVSPSYALSGQREVSFTVLGSNLGTSMDSPTSVSVGGKVCSNPQVLNSSAIRCHVQAPASEWDSSSV